MIFSTEINLQFSLVIAELAVMTECSAFCLSGLRFDNQFFIFFFIEMAGFVFLPFTGN